MSGTPSEGRRLLRSLRWSRVGREGGGDVTCVFDGSPSLSHGFEHADLWLAPASARPTWPSWLVAILPCGAFGAENRPTSRTPWQYVQSLMDSR